MAIEADRLALVPLFADLTEAQQAAVAPRCDEIEVLTGTRLAQEGDYGYKFFVLLEGRATVSIGDETVREMGPGDFFGEIALRGGGKRTADVIATSRCKLLRMMTWDFRQLMESEPELCARIDAEIERRLAPGS